MGATGDEQRLVVARIGKAHGIRGEVTLALHTDSPHERFVPGACFELDAAGAGELTVRTARVHNGVWLVSFDGIADRTAAESLRGARLLLAPPPAATTADEADHAWYEAELVGLRVYDTAGTDIGTVSALHVRPAQDLLEIRLADGRVVPIPFVSTLVPVVDVPGGRIVVDPPGGLFDLAEEL